MDARVSKDSLEPGPTITELPEPAGDIVKNGQILKKNFFRYSNTLSICRFDVQL